MARSQALSPVRIFIARRTPILRVFWFTPVLLTACAVTDSHIARDARTQLMGMTEVDLESCIGVPDQHASFGTTDVLTYYATSTSSDSYSIPLIGGFGFSNGAYCHATFRITEGRVTQILYSGEKNATLAPDAYCAPIMRSCLEHLRGRAASAPAEAVIQADAGTQADASKPANAATSP